MNTDTKSALKPQYIYLDHLKHENPPILNFSESVEMPIDIPRISTRDQDRLVSSVPGPSLLYGADGAGGALSSLGNLVVSLPTVATNEVAEIYNTDYVRYVMNLKIFSAMSCLQHPLKYLNFI